ncbi:hypothetical protein [Streptosporangium sp. NPDC087985]|uniref:hypothetical protein n=1 Tax=Streptosporangium sp. NPDC087985 TaxID=3366196 RepID=UPI0038253056
MADPDARLAEGSDWLEASWPGLDPKKDEIEHNTDKLKNLARELQNVLDRLEGVEKGSLSDLTNRTNVAGMRAAVADWEAGEVFFGSLENGHTKFTHVYGQSIEKLRAAITLINAGAGVYDGAAVANGGGDGK